MAITAPYEGDEDGRGHNIQRAIDWGATRITRSLRGVPPDVEKAIASRAAHARGTLLQPRPLTAVRTYAVACSPGGWEARRQRRSWNDSPARGRSGNDLERGTRKRSEGAGYIKHGFQRRHPHDALPGAPPPAGNLCGAQASPLPAGGQRA